MRFRVEHQNAVAASIQISERKGISRAEGKSRMTEKRKKAAKDDDAEIVPSTAETAISSTDSGTERTRSKQRVPKLLSLVLP